jgi:NAD(P)-dependent dehydrogenase (short-subunit alcohol dehydrogenase family)
LCRFLAFRLKREGVRVNAIATGLIDSANLIATFGEQAVSRFRARGDVALDPGRVAQACVALTSGLMDAVTGQTVVVDEGWTLISPLSFLTGTFDPWRFPDDGPA